MKYMTFNSSCAYAGLANMLWRWGVDTEDREIALKMKLPYLFSAEEGAYLAGPMIQGAKWFDLYLNPLGFQMEEQELLAKEVPAFLRRQKTAMLGLLTEQGKHAVTYVEKVGEKLLFLNNKWQSDPGPEEFLLTGGELLRRVGDTVVVATLKKVPPKEVDLASLISRSVPVLRENYRKITALCKKEMETAILREKLNTLFRPLLLDGITMLELLGEKELAERFRVLQSGFLQGLRQEGKKIRLEEYLSTQELAAAGGCYIRLIEKEYFQFGNGCAIL